MKELEIIRKFKRNIDGHWTGIENTVKSGVPDYSLSYNGEICWIEFKRLYGCDIILRPLQRVWFMQEVPHNQNAAVAWWDDGPCVMYARHLLNIEPVPKGGKLYYYVSDHACTIRGWANIKHHLFKEAYV